LIKAGFTVPYSGWGVMEKVIDKWKTYQAAGKAEVPFPNYDFIDYSDQAKTKNFISKYAFPILLKPRESYEFKQAFKKALIPVNNIEETFKWLEICRNKGINLIVQEMIPGGVENLVCIKLIRNGKNHLNSIFMDRKIIDNSFKNIIVGESIWVPKLIEYASKLLGEIGFIGAASVEFKLDPRDNDYKLMEINGRISMNNSHATKCGVNWPYNLYLFSKEQKLPRQDLDKAIYPLGSRWVLETRLLQKILEFVFSGQFGKAAKACSYFLLRKQDVCAVFSWNDLKPFFYNVSDSIIPISKNLFKRKNRK